MTSRPLSSSDWPAKYEGLITTIGASYPESNFISLVSRHRHALATFRFDHLDPKALVVMFHGMHMSSFDFSHLGLCLHDEGFAVAAFDQEGHGLSGGEKGTIASFESLGEDCAEFVRKTRELYKQGLKTYIVGLSMGGALAVLTGIDHPELVDGVVLLGASLGVDPNFEPFLQKMVRCFNACCCGKLRLKAIDQNLVSRNPNYFGYFHDNPEFFAKKLNVKTACAMLDGFGRLQRRLGEFDRPVIVFHGEQDKLASVEQAKHFVEVCKSADKEIRLFPDMFHVVTHEPEFPLITSSIISWISSRCQSNA